MRNFQRKTKKSGLFKKKEKIKKIQEKIDQGIEEMSDPELLLKRYLPLGIQGIEQFQQFMSMAAKAATGKSNKDD